MTALTLRFTMPADALSVNKSNSLHWATRKRRLDPWKDAAWATAHNARMKGLWPTQRPVDVRVDIPFRQRRRRDPHNYTGTVVKAVVDGLVRAKIVPDDNADWVTVHDPRLTLCEAPARMTVVVHITPRQEP